MTMKLSITNDDSARTATVRVEERLATEHGWRELDQFTLPPGQQRSVYIHAGSRVEVTENPHA